MAVIVRRPYTIISWRRRLIFECRSPSRLLGCFLRQRPPRFRATTTLCRRSTTTTTTAANSLRRRRSFQWLRNLSRLFRNITRSFVKRRARSGSCTYLLNHERQPARNGVNLPSNNGQLSRLRAVTDDRQKEQTESRL